MRIFHRYSVLMNPHCCRHAPPPAPPPVGVVRPQRRLPAPRTRPQPHPRPRPRPRGALHTAPGIRHAAEVRPQPEFFDFDIDLHNIFTPGGPGARGRGSSSRGTRPRPHSLSRWRGAAQLRGTRSMTAWGRAPRPTAAASSTSTRAWTTRRLGLSR